ncbi:T9SS type A sorting domain-containing protein [bacterium]|nr:T9SS type A sorting domain-containing protein [bacterium]MBU1984223.1 T9SS type A sorting domain-containing protein [bacterium]
MFVLAVVILLTLAGSAPAQTFNDFLARLYSLPESERPAIVDSFMAVVQGFPYLENDTVAHFIYRGTAQQVTVPGDANNWNPNSYPMNTVSGTDFWYHSRGFESDARLDYKFVLNGSTWILDPRNPYTVVGGYGPNSELRMPDYAMPPEIEYRPEIPHGALRDTMFYSTNLGNTRRVRVYTPPDYNGSEDSFGIILFHDGLEYIALASANNVLDYLIWQQRIAPVIAVFVPPVNRTGEYAGNLKEEFGAFIVDELMPWVDEEFRTLSNLSQRATLGASNGGNIALWLGLHHGEVFGRIAAQSSNVETEISSAIQSGPQLPLEFYLDLGTYDIPVLIPLVRNFVSILDGRGYTYEYHEYHEGHSWGNWRAHMDNALERFFPFQTGTTPSPPASAPGRIELAVYPNPFNAVAVVQFQLPVSGRVQLVLYNVRGQAVRTVTEGVFSSGSHQVAVDSADLSTGIYFLRLFGAQGNAVQKLLLVK